MFFFVITLPLFYITSVTQWQVNKFDSKFRTIFLIGSNECWTDRTMKFKYKKVNNWGNLKNRTQNISLDVYWGLFVKMMLGCKVYYEKFTFITLNKKTC